jgi:hypothetical protein
MCLIHPNGPDYAMARKTMAQYGIENVRAQDGLLSGLIQGGSEWQTIIRLARAFVHPVENFLFVLTCFRLSHFVSVSQHQRDSDPLSADSSSAVFELRCLCCDHTCRDVFGADGARRVFRHFATDQHFSRAGWSLSESFQQIEFNVQVFPTFQPLYSVHLDKCTSRSTPAQQEQHFAALALLPVFPWSDFGWRCCGNEDLLRSNRKFFELKRPPSSQMILNHRADCHVELRVGTQAAAPPHVPAKESLEDTQFSRLAEIYKPLEADDDGVFAIGCLGRSFHPSSVCPNCRVRDLTNVHLTLTHGVLVILIFHNCTFVFLPGFVRFFFWCRKPACSCYPNFRSR